jgi:glycosyltransferase involved in cell wall biosynthesis
VIGNPYRSDLFRALPEISRENSVVFLGRFVSDKGADLLIRAFAQLNACPAGLTLIGDGPEEASLRRLALELGVQVRFTGPLQGEQLVEELNRHEILAVPSRWAEPFGNVALEGIACGCVVVGSDAGGLPDAIGGCGLLFDRGNQQALTSKLSELLSSQERRRALRANAKQHLAKHSAPVVAESYLEVIKQVCERRRIK